MRLGPPLYSYVAPPRTRWHIPCSSCAHVELPGPVLPVRSILCSFLQLPEHKPPFALVLAPPSRSYFQEQHGWVYSGWCWSMCAIYVLVAWKMAAEAEWLQLAFTPLW